MDRQTFTLWSSEEWSRQVNCRAEHGAWLSTSLSVQLTWQATTGVKHYHWIYRIATQCSLKWFLVSVSPDSINTHCWPQAKRGCGRCDVLLEKVFPASDQSMLGLYRWVSSESPNRFTTAVPSSSVVYSSFIFMLLQHIFFLDLYHFTSGQWQSLLWFWFSVSVCVHADTCPQTKHNHSS